MFNFLNRLGSMRRTLFLLIETLLFFSSVYLSVIFRFNLELTRVLSYPFLFFKALLIMVVIHLSLYYHDLNYSNIGRFRGNLTLKVMQANAVGFFILSILYYVIPFLEVGRGILLIDMALLFVISLSLRIIYLQQPQSEDYGERAVIIGTGSLARQIGKTLHQQPELGYKIVGFIDESLENIGKPVVNPKVIGAYEGLLGVVQKHKIQTIISALPEQRGKLPVGGLLQCRLFGIKVYDGTSFFERLRGKIALDELKPSWVIFSDGFYSPKLTLILKRGLDLVFSITGLFLTAPLFALIGVFIKLGSHGPVFYQQERVGERGKIFTIFKLRSMQDDAESDTGPVWAKGNDERITRIGRTLRKLRLDELPQLVNVLKGDMSLVGPRPERLVFVKTLEKENPYYALRLAVKPGVTGWAQIKYRYGSTTKQAMEKLQYDLYYIKNISVVFDLYILFHTLKIVIMGNGAK
jgi:sugar transferase (PEP-CTERM system associated)